MGVGMLSGLQLSFAFDRSGSQLGGVNVRVLDLFSNSSPTLPSLSSPFVNTTSSRLHSLAGGKEAMTPTHTPHIYMLHVVARC
jgi:hypothetical protein